MRWFIATIPLCCVAFAAGPPPRPELAAPVKVLAGGKALDVERSGHAAPFVGDFDGDGLPDLLVGQFHEGRLRVYLNKGKKGAPRFDGWKWFEAGGKAGRVPVG
jgi:FG-GAP-like repeat